MNSADWALAGSVTLLVTSWQVWQVAVSVLCIVLSVGLIRLRERKGV